MPVIPIQHHNWTCQDLKLRLSEEIVDQSHSVQLEKLFRWVLLKRKKRQTIMVAGKFRGQREFHSWTSTIRIRAHVRWVCLKDPRLRCWKIQVDFFLQSKALTRNQELQLQLLLDARIRSVRKLQMRENSRKKVVSLEGKSTETSIRKKSN